jgi:protein-S-isoprenylcysteine O-methyltransferase Ste14
MSELLSAAGSPLTRVLARYRVPLGFLFAVLAIVLATPTPRLLAAGGTVAALGQALRVWAAGHLEKSREVTSSGPYRWFRHPLYVGSSIMGAGMAIASGSLIVAALVAGYLVATIGSAIRTEEAFLRARFGPEWQAYRAGRTDDDRQFSLERAIRNKEYRAVLGLIVLLLVLSAKVVWLR